MAEGRYEALEIIHSARMVYDNLQPLGEKTNRARHFTARVTFDSPALGLKKGQIVFVKEWLPEMLQEGTERRRQVERAERVYEAIHRAGIRGLVGALDLFEYRGRRYLVTRFLEGAQNPISFYQAVPSRVERQQRLAYLLQELVRLVFELRRLGIVHRDIHWGNVLLDREHNVYLVDFSEALFLNPEGEEYSEIARGLGHQAPGFETPEDLRREPHGPAGGLWQVAALGFALATGITFDRRPEARAGYRQLIPRDLDPGLQDFLSQGLNPDPAVRFSSPEAPLRLLSAVACRPGRLPLARLAGQAAMNLERLLVRYYQDLLPSWTGLGLLTAMVGLASLGELAGGQAQGWIWRSLGSPELAEAAWGALVAGAAGLGAASEPLWRLDWRGARTTALRAGSLSTLGGLAGMLLGSLFLHSALEGSIPGLVVELRLLPSLHLLAWILYGLGAGLGFGTGLLLARWRGIGRAILGGGALGGMAGGVLFVALSQERAPGPVALGTLEAARYSAAAALAAALALSLVLTHRRVVREVRLKAWAKGCPPEIALPRGEPVVIGRSVAPFYLSSERADHLPVRFLEILWDGAELRLTVLGEGRGLLNHRPLRRGDALRLQVGDWIDLGRRSIFRIEKGEVQP